MKKAALILFLILSVQGLCNGEEAVYRLDLSAGLSDNCVNDILMDSRHFLWMGTNAGLDFYDGNNFVKVPFLDTDSSKQLVIFSLCEDPAGTVWAGTSDGLFRLGNDRIQMERYNCPFLDGLSIRQMCCTNGGILWIADKRSNPVRINTHNGKWEVIPIRCRSACLDREGGIYAISNDGHLLLSADGISTPVPLDAGIDEALAGVKVARITSAGNFLFLTSENDRTYALDLRSKEVRPLPLLSRMRDGLCHSSGDFWLAARDGIHVLDSNLTHKKLIQPFHDNSFRCLTEDHLGTVWAGTLFEGIAQIFPNYLHLRSYSVIFSGGSFKARDFAEDLKGRIWIGTDTRGLLCLDSQNGTEKASKQFFAGRNITGLFAEGNDLWVGTIDNELPVMRLDTESGTVTRFPEAGSSAYSFCRDTTGRLWIGGKDGFTVGTVGPEGSFRREIFIPSAQICRIILANDGSVWTASISGQIFHYSALSFNTYDIPVSNILSDIAEDGKGRIYACSEGGGLWVYDSSQDKFQPCPGSESRLLKIAVEKGSPLLWITGAHGIQVLNPDDVRPLPLITRENLGIDSFNYSSNFISTDGTLYAGTSDGFISFSAKKLSRDSLMGAPVISSLHILSSSGRTDGKRYLFPKDLNIGRRPRSFEVNASMLDYARFPRAGLFWKIDGYNDWTPVRDGTFTVYDIPSGNWSIKLKALSLSGRESPETTLGLRAQPPLLLSPMAGVMYLILLLVIIVSIASYSDRRAKAKAEIEHERRLVASKMEFLTAIAHEIRTPLSLVQIPLEALIRKFASSPDSAVQENLDIMRRNSLKLTVLINELLDFRKLSDATFQIHPEFLDIRNILKDAHRRFLPMFTQEGKNLSISMPDTPIYCETDVRAIGRICDNLLTNALKYSSKVTSIRMETAGQDAVISVENDGLVIPEDVRELIFKPFYRYEENGSSKVEGTGLGLSTSRQFSTLLGGSLSMDDDQKVNRFIFRIPLTSETSSASPLPVVETKDKSVMVVEDDKDMARVIGDILSETYGIMYASNGRQALEKLEGGASPSLVVSDIIMPEMDGIALTKALKGNLATSHIPVILLSAEVPDTLMQESLEGGADAYLEKPFSPKKLRSTVDNLIENRRRIYEFYISSLPSSGELPTGRVSAIEQKFLRGIQEYVTANLHRNITLDDLAEVVCLSPSSLYKKLKEYADISPMEYVMKVRLHRAVELLKDDSLSVHEVASSVGFNTHSFFSECFKREFGMTPRQWRTRNVSKPKI